MIRAAGLAFGAASLLLAAPAEAKIHRDRSVIAAFQKAHPCPSNGHQRGACPGWQRDHIIPLECGGADAPANLQWLTVQEHRAKTALDNQQCRYKRR